MEDTYTHLIKPIEGKKLYNLSIREVVLTKSILSETEQNLWFVWQQGWNNWKKLSEVDESLFTFEAKETPEIPENLSEASDVVSAPGFLSNKDYNNKSKKIENIVNTIEDIELEGTSEFHYREHKRIGKRFNIVIEVDGNIFETHTIDISVGGALLEDPLPEWVVGYSKVAIKKPETKEVFSHTCAVVDGQPPEARFRISFAPMKSLERQQKLQAWLAT